MKRLNIYDYYYEYLNKNKPQKICCICNVTEYETKIIKRDDKFYCKKHYLQMYRHNEIKNRTIYDNNEYILYDNYAEIIVYNKEGKEKIRSIIDLNDVDKCKKYKWCESQGYIVTNIDEKKIKIQNIILNKPENKVVDHKNRNKLDNRKINYRFATDQENSMNQPVRSNNTSGVTGVNWCGVRQKWVARITYNYKSIYLGGYVKFDDAVKVRLEAELKYFKEFSPKDKYDKKGVDYCIN